MYATVWVWLFSATPGLAFCPSDECNVTLPSWCVGGTIYVYFTYEGSWFDASCTASGVCQEGRCRITGGQ